MRTTPLPPLDPRRLQPALAVKLLLLITSSFARRFFLALLRGEYCGGSFMLYRLGRRLFYTRCQQLIDIMFPEEVMEFGVDLLWEQADNMLPGAAVSDAVADGEGLNTNCLSYLKDVGFALGGSWLGSKG